MNINEDHPRVCGEQSKHDSIRGKHGGSPPRVRGTESGAGMIGQGNRITPACAGNSARLFFAIKNQADHPRVCGEQRMERRPFLRHLGSPPRVRGTEVV